MPRRSLLARVPLPLLLLAITIGAVALLALAYRLYAVSLASLNALYGEDYPALILAVGLVIGLGWAALLVGAASVGLAFARSKSPVVQASSAAGASIGVVAIFAIAYPGFFRPDFFFYIFIGSGVAAVATYFFVTLWHRRTRLADA